MMSENVVTIFSEDAAIYAEKVKSVTAAKKISEAKITVEKQALNQYAKLKAKFNDKGMVTFKR